MSLIHHAPSPDSIMRRLRALQLKCHASPYGCRIYIEDGPEIECDNEGDSWRKEQVYRLEVRYSDARYRRKRAFMKFKMENHTEGKAWNTSWEYDADLPDEAWARFEPKLKQAIADYALANKHREEISASREKEAKLYSEQCDWLKANAPSFSLMENHIRFYSGSNFEEMKERIQQSHAILFPRKTQPTSR